MNKKESFRFAFRCCALLAVAAMLFPLSGCSAFRSSTQEISIRTEPPDALVSINGKILASPTTLQVPRNEVLFIQISRDGYFPFITTVGHSLNVTGYLDIAGSVFILPAIGLFTPGKRSLDRTDFAITLMPTGN